MKKRILILSFYYPPDLCAGSFRIEALIKALQLQKKNDLDITVITTLPNRYHSFKNEAKSVEVLENLLIHRIKLPEHKSGFLDQAKAFFYFAKSALRIAEKTDYDLVYGTSSRLMTATLAAVIAKRKSVPLYLDVRDIFVDTMADILPKSISTILTPFLSLIERFTINQATHINLVSKGFSVYFKKKYPNARFSFFSNGIDDEFLNYDFKNKEDEKSGKIRILYAGNIGEGQGLHMIIPQLAFSLGDNYLFLIYGDGGKRETLASQLKEKKLKNVIVKDPVKRTELLKNYAEADILFLHLNDHSAFEKVLPSKLFEYAATGKPILAGVAGYSHNFINEHIENAQVFSPCNTEEAIQAIKKLELIQSSRTKFKKDFARHSIMNEMAKSILNLNKDNQ